MNTSSFPRCLSSFRLLPVIQSFSFAPFHSFLSLSLFPFFQYLYFLISWFILFYSISNLFIYSSLQFIIYPFSLILLHPSLFLVTFLSSFHSVFHSLSFIPSLPFFITHGLLSFLLLFFYSYFRSLFIVTPFFVSSFQLFHLSHYPVLLEPMQRRRTATLSLGAAHTPV
jgi:hypothetical protein